MLVIMRALRQVPPSLPVAALACMATACASIWGFQDAVDLSDGGVDASLEAGSLDGARRDGPASGDAAPDVASEAGLDASVDSAGEASAGGCTNACVPAAPSGWQGPLEIYEGVGGPPPPAPPGCGGAYATLAFDGNGAPAAPAATCTCSCGSPGGGTCGAPLANYFSDTNCTQSCGTPNQPIGPSCTTLGLGTCGGTHVTIGASPPTGGSCTPDAGSHVVPPAWGGDVRLCAASVAPTGSGCTAGEVCAPATTLPFEPSTYCVAASGTPACPAGYPVQHVYYGSFSDTRGCSACTCSDPPDASCAGGTAEAYGATSCTGPPSSSGVPESCSSLGAQRAAMVTGLTWTAGPCQPSGGAPTGAFTPTTPTTICCTQ